MKIFISGATGFVGSHLSENLIGEEHEIKALVLKPSEVPFLKTLGVEITYGDITDYTSVKKAMRGCELVYHTAATLSSTRCKYSVHHDVNVKGTENVMRAVLETGARHVVYCSTAGVYRRLEKVLSNENSPLNADNFYQISKLEGEKVVTQYCNKHGISSIIARLAPIYGPRDKHWLKFFQDIVNGRFLAIGSGENYIHITYIDDIIQGLKLCGNKQDSVNELYIIGGGDIPTVNQFVNTVVEESGIQQRPKKLPETPFAILNAFSQLLTRQFNIELQIMRGFRHFSKNYMHDISKAKKELNYRPRISLHEGIKRTITWYRENGYI